MTTKATNNLSRITIDLSKEAHKKLKTQAAIQGRSMRELILEAIELIDDCPYSHIPNAETLKSMEDTEKGIGLIQGKEADEISKKLGL